MVFFTIPVLLIVNRIASMEKPEQIWFLLSRNLSGEATAQEKEALMQALQQQPALMQQYELLQRLWKPDRTATQEEVQTKISHILQRSAREEADTQETRRATPATDTGIIRYLKKVRWAAAIAGLTLAIWTWSNYRQTPTIESNEIVAKKGSKTRTLLPDGSTVWLNAGSSILYDPTFSGNAREVTLQGEAYFDIVKQAGKPFIVHAGGLNIKVLGTAFNVKSYAEEHTIETTLIHGLVQITGKAGKTILLHPNQKIILPKNDEQPPAVANNTNNQQASQLQHTLPIVNLDSSLKENERLETAWLYNRLEFRGDRFDQLAKKLERWYNITIHFQDQQAANLVFNGSLENETIEQAFQALTTAEPFQFDIKGNEIYINSIKPK